MSIDKQHTLPVSKSTAHRVNIEFQTTTDAYLCRAQGCIVEYEGVKKHKHYTFGVVDRAGNSLIRVSTTQQGDAQRWMEALQRAGAELRTLSSEARSRSPLRSADVRWVRFHAMQHPG